MSLDRRKSAGTSEDGGIANGDDDGSEDAVPESGPRVCMSWPKGYLSTFGTGSFGEGFDGGTRFTSTGADLVSFVWAADAPAAIARTAVHSLTNLSFILNLSQHL
jgi:hypothetical protein